MSSLPASIKRIGSKTTQKRWRHHFSHYKLMGAFCCHGNQRFDSICPLTLCSLSLTPMMLQIKFHQDWPTGYRDIQTCDIFVTQGQVTPKWVVWLGRNLNSSEILCMSSLSANIKRIESKATEKRWRHHFPHYKSIGTFWFDFCFTALQHILGNFGRGQLT